MGEAPVDRARLLQTLAAMPGRVFTRENLIDSAVGDDFGHSVAVEGGIAAVVAAMCATADSGADLQGVFLSQGDQFAVRSVDGGPAPEVDPVFIADPVGAGDEIGEQAGISLVDLLNPSGRFKLLITADPAPW